MPEDFWYFERLSGGLLGFNFSGEELILANHRPDGFIGSRIFMPRITLDDYFEMAEMGATSILTYYKVGELIDGFLTKGIKYQVAPQ